MSIFRTATQQAIRDIITDHSSPGRFGHVVGEESMATICERITDLFEMTLELRGRVQGALGTPAPPGSAAKSPPAETSPVPRLPSARGRLPVLQRTRSPEARAPSPVEPPQRLGSVGGSTPLGLPKTRVGMSPEEQERVRQAFGK